MYKLRDENGKLQEKEKVFLKKSELTVRAKNQTPNLEEQEKQELEGEISIDEMWHALR